MEMWLSSQKTIRLPSSWVPASEEASEETPSCRSPSEAITYTRWSNGEVPSGASGSSRPRTRRWANAIPTAVASPWPSGPVVVSTPVVCPTSGCPGVSEPQRSEEHTSELQSRGHLVCRLLLEKKKQLTDCERAGASAST